MTEQRLAHFVTSNELIAVGSAAEHAGSWRVAMKPEGSPMTTQDLFLRVQTGDERAVQLLYDRYLGRVRMWGRGRLRGEARSLLDTNSLAHDVLIQVLLRIPSLREAHEVSFKGYLRTSLRNAVINANRRARIATVDLESVEAALVDPQPDPAELAVCRQFEDSLICAFNGLGEQQQQLILLRKVEDLSHADVARRLGYQSEDAARIACVRAYEKMRAAMMDMAS